MRGSCLEVASFALVSVLLVQLNVLLRRGSCPLQPGPGPSAAHDPAGTANTSGRCFSVPSVAALTSLVPARSKLDFLNRNILIRHSARSRLVHILRVQSSCKNDASRHRAATLRRPVFVVSFSARMDLGAHPHEKHHPQASLTRHGMQSFRPSGAHPGCALPRSIILL